MRVFVTGATGTIGSVVVPELLAGGHTVVGLARSDAAAAKLEAVGAQAHLGALADRDALHAAAAAADGVVHLAFSNDFTNLEQGIAEEAGAIETFCAALEGTGKPLTIVSGTPIAPGRPSTEADPAMTEGPVGGRGRASVAALAFADKGVRVGLVRLPRSVHAAHGPSGFASILAGTAQRTGVSGYLGDGAHRWPAVHQRDAARLFRLVLEQGEPGTVVHAVGDEAIPMRTLAEAIGAQLGLQAAEVEHEHFGPFAAIFAVDQPATATQTRERFGWEPTEPGLLDDVRSGIEAL